MKFNYIQLTRSVTRTPNYSNYGLLELFPRTITLRSLGIRQTEVAVTLLHRGQKPALRKAALPEHGKLTVTRIPVNSNIFLELFSVPWNTVN